MSEANERILCAAIWFDDGKQYAHQPLNIPTGFVACGFRHCSIFGQVMLTAAARQKLGFKETQGFLTNTNTFVGREEAAKIAIEAGQVKQEELHVQGVLFSEDLY